MHLIDTHCHLHDDSFEFDIEKVIKESIQNDVLQIICVGTGGEDSQKAAALASTRAGLFSSAGLHPHDARLGEDDLELIARVASEPKVVAIGEIGLDYYYNNSPMTSQRTSLEYQLQLALSFNLPCIFHVREAFDDFWTILDNFPGVRGVIHSFTAGSNELEQALNRDLYIGLNGIITFSKDQNLEQVCRHIPSQKIVLETDAPFLTPTPLRGKVNVPANVRLVAACLAKMRGVLPSELIEATTKNAQLLFSLPKSEILTD